MNDLNASTRFSVMSSRIRLARNVEGLPFPCSGKSAMPDRMLSLVGGAMQATSGLFDCDLYLMSRLNKEQKSALVERHMISLPLANNTATGAVIIERQSESMSIMLNEEDHIREQCVVTGFDLNSAFLRINDYDDQLLETLPIAYDQRLGFLTACPTNIGTGLRASTMLFLPSLKLAGAIESAITKFTVEYGLTIRGIYGEGSSADGDMYQLSNSKTLGLSEDRIIRIVEEATIEMCQHEQRATEKLAREKGSELIDKVWRSYGILKNAYKLSSSELMSLISDVKLGIILDILPLKDTKPLDEIVLLCSESSLKLTIKDCTAEQRDIARAKLMRKAIVDNVCEKQ